MASGVSVGAAGRWWVVTASAGVALLLGGASFLLAGRGWSPHIVPREVAAAPLAATGASLRPLDYAAARRIYTLEKSALLRYDPVAHVLLKPNRRREFAWEEHPAGKVHTRTNNLGFNEDAPTAPEKSGLRILVAGDSHTAGVVDNSESFCSVAERELQRLLGRTDVEVLNAGVPFTSPTCYAAVLERYLELEPDVFVAVLFVGNDFCEETHIGSFTGRWSMPEVDPRYVATAREVVQRWEGPFSQGLNQAYRWKSFPDEAERALDAVRDSYRAMQALCDERGIAFLAALLPTKMDVDEDDRSTWRAACDALGLAEPDVGRALELGRRLLAESEAEGIESLDPTDAMVRSEEVLYWRKDYHLSLDGHALFGGLLARTLAPRL